MQKNTLLFKTLTKINPPISVIGGYLIAKHHHIGWYLLIFYNLCNIYVYLKRKRDFWTYATFSCLHIINGLLAIFG